MNLVEEIRFKNEHLSVSRLKLLEQCALSFFFRYVDPEKDQKAKAPRGDAADFGVVLHAALEMVYHWIVAEEYAGAFPEAELLAYYRDAWQASDLVNVAMYQEGVQMLKAYARSHYDVDSMRILAVEQEFNVDVGGFVMNGYIDRVDKLDDDTIEIIDYKSNRKLFTREEMDVDLQFSAYGLAARRLYPWAKRAKFSFHMLRFDTHQDTTRAATTIDDAAGYIVALGKRSESMKEWKPRLNENCGYCDHRKHCPSYAEALAGKAEITKVVDLEDVGQIAREREAVAKLAKMMYARKEELDKLLKKRIEESGEFAAADWKYRFINQFSTVYTLDKVTRVFVDAGLSPEDVRKRVLYVDDKEVEKLRLEVSEKLDRSRSLMLKTSLEAIQEKVPLTPKFDSRVIHKEKKVDP